jgi:hypothetical protein
MAVANNATCKNGKNYSCNFLKDMPPDGKEVDKGLNVPKKDF